MIDSMSQKMEGYSPEKAGVGGSIPSLATIEFSHLAIFISPHYVPNVPIRTAPSPAWLPACRPHAAATPERTERKYPWS